MQLVELPSAPRDQDQDPRTTILNVLSLVTCVNVTH